MVEDLTEFLEVILETDRLYNVTTAPDIAQQEIMVQVDLVDLMALTAES
jgi:hypothetical protein